VAAEKDVAAEAAAEAEAAEDAAMAAAAEGHVRSPSRGVEAQKLAAELSNSEPITEAQVTAWFASRGYNQQR
jgi:hypothetical protein